MYMKGKIEVMDNLTLARKGDKEAFSNLIQGIKSKLYKYLTIKDLINKLKVLKILKNIYSIQKKQWNFGLLRRLRRDLQA